MQSRSLDWHHVVELEIICDGLEDDGVDEIFVA